MANADDTDPGFSGKVFKGAFLLSSLRWAIRLIGLVSVSINARILTPEDFGVHSTAAILVGLFLILQYGGVIEFLVRRKSVNTEVINSAWTVRVALSTLVGLAIVAVSPFAPDWLNEPRITLVLILFACIPILEALENPRMLLLLRDMKYGELFRVRLFERVLGAVIGVSAVLYFRNYIGIIAGALISSVTFTLYTYFRWPDRPRFTLTYFREIGAFASIATVRSICNYIADLADSIAARQISGSAVFGGYHNSKDLGRTLITEVSAPIGTALLPALAQMRSDPKRMTRAIKYSFGAILLLTVGLSLGLHLLATEAITIVLGNQWLFAIPYLEVAVLLIGASTLTQVLGSIFVSLDKQNIFAILLAIKAALAIAASVYLIQFEDLMLLLYGGTVVSLATFTIALVWLSVVLRTGYGFFGILFRPALAGAAMFYLSPLAYNALNLETWMLGFAAITKVAIGGAIYGITIAAAWLLTGHAEGPEQALLDRTGINWRRYLS